MPKASVLSGAKCVSIDPASLSNQCAHTKLFRSVLASLAIKLTFLFSTPQFLIHSMFPYWNRSKTQPGFWGKTTVWMTFAE